MKNLFSLKKLAFSIYFFVLIVLLFSSCKRDKFGRSTEEIDFAYLIPETEVDEEEAQIWIKQLIGDNQSKLYLPDFLAKEALQKQLYLFYEKNNFQPAWYSATQVLPHTQSLMSYLKNADSEGLNREAYALRDIDKIQNQLLGADGKYDLPKLMKLEVFTTAMALTYLNHVHVGRVKPTELENKENIWMEEYKPIRFVNELYSAVQHNTFDDILKKAEPQYELYKKLKVARDQYDKIVKKGGWKKIDITNYQKIKIDTTEEFSRHELIPTIRSILLKTGDLPFSETALTDTSQFYDKELIEAIKKFQERHTLERDGIVGMNVLRELAQPAEERLAQINLNMERLRWLRDSLGQSYLIVNVPAYWMKLYDSGKRNFETKVMVGRHYHATPLFMDTIEYIALSPKWHVPVSIATNELLPKLRRGGNYFERNNFTIYQRTSRGLKAINPNAVNWNSTRNMGSYSVVQGSGSSNALGRVKFIFPNSNNIYMHDTPSTQFDKANRALSHGCIRLYEPEKLAYYLLSQQNGEFWTKDKVQEGMYGGKTKNVFLDRKWIVHLVYWTTWVDDEGKIHFAKDVYGYDQAQKNILAHRDAKLKEWMKKRSEEFDMLRNKNLVTLNVN